MNKTVLLFVLLIQVYLLSAQTKPYIHFNENDGLPNSIVQSLVFDKAGYLWIGTESGLSKYDGQKFQNYYEKNGLPSNRVWSLAVDNSNRIYAACYNGGIAVLENDSIIKTFHINNKRPNSVRKLYFSRDFNALFIGTDYGIYVLKNDTIKEIEYEKDPLRKSSILSITENNGIIYFSVHGGYSGLYTLEITNINPLQYTVKRYTDHSNFNIIIYNKSIYTNDSEAIYTGSLKDLNALFKVKTMSKDFLAWSMEYVGDNQIYLGGFGAGEYIGGLKKFNINTQRVTPSPYQIQPLSVNQILNDNNHNLIWVASYTGLYALQKSPFEYVDLKKIGTVLDIEIQNDILYVLTSDAIYKVIDSQPINILSRKKLEDVILDIRDNQFQEITDKSSHTIFDKSAMVFNNFQKNNGQLFVNTSRGTINLSDMKDYYPFAYGQFFDSKKNGAYHIQHYEKLKYYSNPKTSLKNHGIEGVYGEIRDIIEIAQFDSTLLFASNFNGLFALKKDSIYYLNKGLNPNFEDVLSDIEIDRWRNTIWCTSVSGNLYNVGFSDRLFIKEKYNNKNSGIVGESFKWVKVDSLYTYVGTNKGLNVIPNSKTIGINDTVYFFNKNNGYEFISASSPIANKEGEIFLHSTNTLIKINPDFFKKAKRKILNIDIKVDNASVLLGHLDGTKLSYKTKSISINYKVLSYPSSNNIRYRYQINNSQWVSGQNIQLQALKSGRYELLLEAKNLETNLISQQRITFSISLPYWREWWFLSLLFTFIGSGVAFILKWRLKQIKRREDEKSRIIKKNVELQIRSLQVQMNPHFIFNALNSVQNFILTNNTEESLIFLSNLGSIIRTNLENVAKNFIPLSDEVKFLQKYVDVEISRFKEKLNIELINSANDQKITIPPMLIQPIIENAIKHGVRGLESTGIIKIYFEKDENTLIVSVIDNGVGFKNATKDKRHNSKGLNLIKHRLDLLNQTQQTSLNTLTITDLGISSNQTGTQVVVRLKLNQ